MQHHLASALETTGIKYLNRPRYEPTEWTTPHYSSPPSPPATSTEPSHNFSSSLPPKPSVICSVTDFKPPHFPSMTEGGGISDPGSAPRCSNEPRIHLSQPNPLPGSQAQPTPPQTQGWRQAREHPLTPHHLFYHRHLHLLEKHFPR